MARRILLTGARGKVGRVLGDLLEHRGQQVVRGTRHPVADGEVRLDWDDPTTWAPALAGVDAVHLVKPPLDPGPLVERFLAGARDVTDVVLLSEIARDQRPDADSDRRAELAVESGPWRWTVLRPSWFFQNWGPEGRWGEEVRTTGELRLACGEAHLSLVDTRDVAEVAAVALLSGAGLGGLTVTGAERVRMRDYAAAVTEVSGRPVRHVSRSLAEERSALEAAGSDPRAVDFYVGLLTDIVEGRAGVVTDDVARVLGRPPRALADYLAENADFWSTRVGEEGLEPPTFRV